MGHPALVGECDISPVPAINMTIVGFFEWTLFKDLIQVLKSYSRKSEV